MLHISLSTFYVCAVAKVICAFWKAIIIVSRDTVIDIHYDCLPVTLATFDVNLTIPVSTT